MQYDFFLKTTVKMLLHLILPRDFCKKDGETSDWPPYNSYEGKMHKKGFQGLSKGDNPFNQ